MVTHLIGAYLLLMGICSLCGVAYHSENDNPSGAVVSAIFSVLEIVSAIWLFVQVC